MPVEKLEYPAVLTKAGWDKNKGIAAKMFVGKTDVGASLAEVERLFKENGFADVKAFAGLDPIEAEAHKNALFCLKHAAASPLMEIGAARAEHLGEGVYRVAVTVKNRGYLPTNVTEQAKAVKAVKPVRAEVPWR